MQLLEEVFSVQKSKLTDKDYDKVESSASDAVFLISFYLRETRFATPIDRVKEVIEDATITPLPIPNNTYAGILNLRGNLIPVLAAERLLLKDSYTSSNTLNEVSTLPRRFVVLESKEKDTFAIEAVKVHKVECPKLELKNFSGKFCEVIQIEGSPVQLLDFFAPEAKKILTAGDELT